MAALHRGQDTIRASLHRQVQVRRQLRQIPVRLDQAIRELHRVRGSKTNTANTLDLRHVAQQLRQVGAVASMFHSAIGIYVLPEQGHFAHALFG